MSSVLWSAFAVIQSCFAINFELQCASEHVHCVTHGIIHAYILNTYCPALRAVHMLTLAVYEKKILHYGPNPPRALHVPLLTPQELQIPP